MIPLKTGTSPPRSRPKRRKPRIPRIKLPIPFRLGDVVREVKPRDFGSYCAPDDSDGSKYKARRQAEWENRDRGRTHIIHETKLRVDGYIEYSTNHGAWFPHTSFELVEACSTNSLNRLLRDYRAEIEGEEGDE